MTIKDLAAKTGYAVGTVSRALNHHPNVSDKARRVILQAAMESGFELNQNAKQLKQQHSTTILVIVKGTCNVFFAEMLETIQAKLSETRYQLTVEYMDEEQNEVLRAVQLCREKKPLGVMFLGGSLRNFAADFDKLDLPCLLSTGDASGLNFSNLSSVTTDDREAGNQAIDTLIGLGHHSIAVIGGDRLHSDISRLRYEGCQTAFERWGISFDPERHYRTVHFTYQGGYEATRELLQSDWNFTAIYAMSDVMIVGAMRALGEAGLKVPQDVSVIGMDGLPLGDYLLPQLSTIRQSATMLARRSVELLLSAIEDGTPARHEMVPFQVLRRESVRAIIDEGGTHHA